MDLKIILNGFVICCYLLGESMAYVRELGPTLVLRSELDPRSRRGKDLSEYRCELAAVVDVRLISTVVLGNSAAYWS